MITFKNLMLEALPNDAHCRFFGDAVKKLAAAGDDVKKAVEPLDAELYRLYAIEIANMDRLRKSPLTEPIAAARRRLNRAVTGFSKQVNAARHSFHPAVAEAAEQIRWMVRSYGKVISKSYDRAIADVAAILRHLNGDFAVERAGVMAWIPEITDACNELVALLAERDAESLGKPEMNFRETRRAMNKVWRQIVKIVNGGAAIRFSSEFERFINALNPEIERLNKAHRRVRTDIVACEPAPIPGQVYTGFSCTPVPEVRLQTKGGAIRLALGKDFTVACKNNIRVGNATCIIRGMGAYRGKKMVTFMIETAPQEGGRTPAGGAEAVALAAAS